MTLIEDLRAFVRGLYRLRKELQTAGAWVHVESACTELTKAITILELKRAETWKKKLKPPLVY